MQRLNRYNLRTSQRHLTLFGKHAPAGGLVEVFRPGLATLALGVLVRVQHDHMLIVGLVATTDVHRVVAGFHRHGDAV